ncbi:MAG: M14 family zinc carboxypeptidase, partial [Myxococcota bacterium]
MRTSLPELELYETILGRLGSRARVEVMDRVRYRGEELPLYGTVLGSSDPNVPTFGLVGGVHGLERIGSRVVLAWMHTLSELLDWDDLVVQALECTRLVFAPIVNPWGLLLRKRSNVSGVDLMRNAPPHDQGRGSLLVGGQRISPRLPWYMGE